jgi:hypothetical protein
MLCDIIETRLSVVASLDFTIVDEFDQFVVENQAELQSEARYAEQFRRLMNLLPKQTRYVIKSATLGLKPRSPKSLSRVKVDRRSELIETLLNPLVIAVAERRYAAVLPYQRITEVPVQDTNVSMLLGAVSVSKGKAHLGLDLIIGPVDYADVERRAPSLCEGAVDRSVKLRFASGHM